MKRKYFTGLLAAALVMLLLPAVKAQSFEKSRLKVLYVGGSSNYSDTHYASAEDRETDVKARMASFEGMLKQYFETVAVVRDSLYNSAMSFGYDVTVVDGVPGSKRYKPGYVFGKWLQAEKSTVLSADFDKPMLFIGETGFNLGSELGLKFDWYCLCLGSYALKMKSSHEIFKGPFPVNISTEKREVPYAAKAVDYKRTLPPAIPMWAVQTQTYDVKDFRPGLVSHPGGFDDSPDAEVISGGTSQKDINAVALARHGNFFHWGFSASPAFLTPSAQTVLANAIVYIAKFNGKGVIARKYNDRITTTYEIREKRDMASRTALENINTYYKQLEVDAAKARKELQDKKDKGVKLTDMEEAVLKNFKAPEQMTMESFLKSFQGALFEKFGMDLNAYIKYYNDNIGFFYPGKDGEIIIDEDLKKLNIHKNDPRLLDAAIRLWEKGQDAGMAKRILSRYTLAGFGTPVEWRSWYEGNKGRFFFTESGGYYFLINTTDKLAAGNDYKKKEKQAAYSRIVPGGTDNQHAVSVAVGVVPGEDGKSEIVVKLRIHPGYHIYGYVSEQDPYLKTGVKITLPDGYAAAGPLQVPASVYFNPSGTTIYQGEIMFSQEVTGRGGGNALCSVSYQCCDESICFPPADRQFTVKI